MWRTNDAEPKIPNMPLRRTNRAMTLFLVATLGTSSAWTPAQTSSFVGSALQQYSHASSSSHTTWTMYHSNADPPHSDGRASTPPLNAWTVLSQTERWIQTTLDGATCGESNTAIARKAVSYVCEHYPDSAMIVARLFRHLKEEREKGQAHGRAQVEAAKDDPDAAPRTLRHTLVVVIPSVMELEESFDTFDGLVQAINQARRNARDFVTDRYQTEDDWSVGVTCAHLHPLYSDTSAGTEQQQQQQQPDVYNAKEVEYKRLRLAARQSPYPTVVVEVRASPPIETGDMASTAAAMAPYGARGGTSQGDGTVTLADLQKVHSLFGKTALIKESVPSKDAFWDAIGDSLPEVTTVKPVDLTQQWIADRIRAQSGSFAIPADAAAFTTSETAVVDEAFEFVFTNIAMLQDQAQRVAHSRPHHQFLIMPQFLPAAATSFEKFGREVSNLVASVPSLRDCVTLVTYHPEHVESSHRSPTPVLALTWIHPTP